MRVAALVACAALLVIGACAGSVMHPPHRHHQQQPSDIVRRHAKAAGLNVRNVNVIGDNETAVMTVLVHESLFRKLVNAVLPALIAEATKITIPGKSEKHFSYKDITLSEFNIGSLDIGFSSPNHVNVNLKDLSLKVPDTEFEVKDKLLFIHVHCKGHFSVDVQNTNIAVQFGLTDKDGKLTFDDGTATVTFGKLDVNHKFDGDLCKIGQDIIQVFVGNINDLIKKIVEKDISPMVTKALNAAFQKMADKVTLPLAAAPEATSDSIELKLNLLGFKAPKGRVSTAAQRTPLKRLPAPLKRNSTFPDRDLEVFFSQEATNALIRHFYNQEHLNVHIPLPINTSSLAKWLPAAYSACPGCKLELELLFHSCPTMAYQDGVRVNFSQVETVLAARNGSKHDNSDLVTLIAFNMNGTGGFDNFTVQGAQSNVLNFKLDQPSLGLSLISSAVGPIDAQLLADVVDFVLDDVVVPDFNKNFNGLPIPPIENVTVVGVVVDMKGTFDIGLNLEL